MELAPSPLGGQLSSYSIQDAGSPWSRSDPSPQPKMGTTSSYQRPKKVEVFVHCQIITIAIVLPGFDKKKSKYYDFYHNINKRPRFKISLIKYDIVFNDTYWATKSWRANVPFPSLCQKAITIMGTFNKSIYTFGRFKKQHAQGNNKSMLKVMLFLRNIQTKLQ